MSGLWPRKVLRRFIALNSLFTKAPPSQPQTANKCFQKEEYANGNVKMDRWNRICSLLSFLQSPIPISDVFPHTKETQVGRMRNVTDSRIEEWVRSEENRTRRRTPLSLVKFYLFGNNMLIKSFHFLDEEEDFQSVKGNLSAAAEARSGL